MVGWMGLEWVLIYVDLDEFVYAMTGVWACEITCIFDGNGFGIQ